MWTPRFRWIPAHRMQIKMPKFHEDHLGPVREIPRDVMSYLAFCWESTLSKEKLFKKTSWRTTRERIQLFLVQFTGQSCPRPQLQDPLQQGTLRILRQSGKCPDTQCLHGVKLSRQQRKHLFGAWNRHTSFDIRWPLFTTREIGKQLLHKHPCRNVRESWEVQSHYKSDCVSHLLPPGVSFSTRWCESPRSGTSLKLTFRPKRKLSTELGEGDRPLPRAGILSSKLSSLSRRLKHVVSSTAFSDKTGARGRKQNERLTDKLVGLKREPLRRLIIELLCKSCLTAANACVGLSNMWKTLNGGLTLAPTSFHAFIFCCCCLIIIEPANWACCEDYEEKKNIETSASPTFS